MRWRVRLGTLAAAGIWVLLNPAPARAAVGPEGQVESCEVPAQPGARPSDLFLLKLAAISKTGLQLQTAAGAPMARAVTQFRVTSPPLAKEIAGRWKQNGLWAGPCAGLVAVFQASALEKNKKDPNHVVDLYELRYASEAAARRVAALLQTSWDWNGHPFIAVQRGPAVTVVEGRYGAWNALETVGAHFGGAVYPRHAPVALSLCAKGANERPLVDKDGMAVHVLGFAPSGELAWLEETPGPRGGAAWNLRVSNLANDREVAARAYRTDRPGAQAFCARYREDAGAFLTEQGVSGGAFSAFDKTAIGGEPISIGVQSGKGSAKEIVMEGPSGSKVLGRVPGTAGTPSALGFIQSPFEERVAVFVLTHGTPNGHPSLRVLGGRLDKRWMAKE